MSEPHESWADVYDIAYEQSFGGTYRDLTSATVDTISNVVKPPARIVDFGAGTGRLSIPLSSVGFDVLAVEPSKGMLDQLKSKPGGSSVGMFHGKMEDFQSDTPFDMALCVFTVLLYLLDEDTLRKSIQASAQALHPGGLMLIDIPKKSLFKGYQRNSPTLERLVAVLKTQDDDIYQYSEFITLNSNGETKTYTDHFRIKYWQPEEVFRILLECGFSAKKDMTAEFGAVGSSYHLMEKER